MLQIDGTAITLTRGDSATISVSATIDGTSPPTSYTFQVGDKVKFTVKQSAKDTEELISKEITVATAGTSVEISLAPNDTKQLEFGKYKYDIQLTKANGWVDTIVTKSTFKVGDEIG